ncbi:MAG: membrane protein insertion efficiency factor YidD [Chitinophagales bacterium]|nr:membrane protein insertion efficiency factor YidD [Chitinophagales bacterium]
MKAFSRLLAYPFIWLIQAYKLIVSPWMPSGCRYQPTCSQYGVQALREHGVFKGLWLTVRRLSRCHPWGGHGYDPVP